MKLFGIDFVKRNKNNCKIIVNIKEQELKEKYVFGCFERVGDELQIKLKAINNIIDIYCIFYSFPSLLSIPDISNWNTIIITNMSQIFYYCSSLLILPDLSKLDISNVSDILLMLKV